MMMVVLQMNGWSNTKSAFTSEWFVSLPVCALRSEHIHRNSRMKDSGFETIGQNESSVSTEQWSVIIDQWAHESFPRRTSIKNYNEGTQGNLINKDIETRERIETWW